VTLVRICLYDVTETGKNGEKLNKSFSYKMNGKTLTTLKLSTGLLQSDNKLTHNLLTGGLGWADTITISIDCNALFQRHTRGDNKQHEVK